MKMATLAQAKTYYLANRNKVLVYQENYRKTHRDSNIAYQQVYQAQRRLSKWDKLFGWAAGTSERLMASKTSCDLCGQPFGDTNRLRKVLDHDHETNTFRGVIHRKCNLGISDFDDDFERILAAAAYIQQSTLTQVPKGKIS
jgi:hypothetical protein